MYGFYREERRSPRLSNFDYSSAGYYFITAVTHRRTDLFGEIRDGKMILNSAGGIVDDCIVQAPRHFSNIVIAEHVVMPNHIHALIGIRYRIVKRANDEYSAGRPSGPSPASVGAIVGSIKSSCSRLIHAQEVSTVTRIWQRGFFDVIVNSPEELLAYRRYIQANPQKEWERRNRT